jgi:hypothetical protein
MSKISKFVEDKLSPKAREELRNAIAWEQQLELVNHELVQLLQGDRYSLSVYKKHFDSYPDKYAYVLSEYDSSDGKSTTISISDDLYGIDSTIGWPGNFYFDLKEHHPYLGTEGTRRVLDILWIKGEGI